MNEKTTIDVNKVPRITKFIYTLGVLPTSYLMSMTYEEQLVWLCNYIQQTLIPAINTDVEAVKELQELYELLRTYVNEYFDNLDVQEEIDNKLNLMVKDGTFDEIINERLFTELNTKYTKAIITYNNLEDMINDETIEVNQIIYVLGDKILNDGFSGYYKIIENGIENEKYCIKLNNNLYASLINEIEENFYKSVYYETKRENNTTYYLTYIPFKDENNEQINIYLSQAENNLTPNEHAITNNTNVTINASLSINNGDSFVDGIAIGNGVILRDYDISSIATDEKYLGITENRDIMIFSNDTTAQSMINSGIKNAFLIFGQCVINGNIDNNFTHHLKNDADQYIGQKPNKDIIILTCEGRNSNNIGFNYITASNILINLGCDNVYALDGGGSTSTSYRGIKINSNIDNNGTEDRKISFLLDVKKTITNKKTAEIYGMIGKVKQLICNELNPLINNKESKNLTTKVKIGNQIIQPNINNGEKLTSYIPSTPYSSNVKFENGNIDIILPDLHTSNLPYNIKIDGHIILYNNTNSNTSLYVYIVEDNNIESTYRITVGSHDYVTFNINEIIRNISSSHTYSLYINAGDTSNTISVIDGNLYVTYIPKQETFI